MTSNPQSHLHHSSHQPKHFPLHLHNPNSQTYTLLSHSHKPVSSHKSSNPSQQHSLSSKNKSTRHHQATKENIPDSRTTTISIISRIPDEKEEALFVPSHNIKGNKPCHSTEKSFQDLNKSLANLALKRCIVRSSSDNETIGKLNHTTETDFQRSYGPSQNYTEAQPAYNSISTTPYSNKQAAKTVQPTVQKGMEVTPFSFVNQIDRESVRQQSLQGKREASSKDLTLSDLEYGRMQNSMLDKSARGSQNAHYFPVDLRYRTQGRNLVTEGSYQMEFSQIENLDNTESQMCSQYVTKDIQLSYLNGEYFQEEIETENVGDNDCEDPLETVRHISVKQQQNSRNNNVKKMSSQPNYRSTPSFKGNSKLGKTSNSSIPSRNKVSNPRRYSDLASIPRVTEKRMDKSMGGQKKNCDKLELNNISDGVEYMKGGVGMNSQVRKKQKPTNCNKSSFIESNHTSSKMEGVESIRRETLDTWKSDLMNIKKEMETRKKSYAEVHKFVRMHDNGSTASQSRETCKSSFDLYATRKTSNLSSINVNKLEKLDTVKSYSSGFKALHGNGRDIRRQSRSKCSLELRTVEDYSDQRSALTHFEDQGSAVSKLRLKTAPYNGFNNETNEATNTFFYDDNFIYEKTQREACCGPEKMCNIF